jgi:hypothetical protein
MDHFVRDKVISTITSILIAIRSQDKPLQTQRPTADSSFA